MSALEQLVRRVARQTRSNGVLSLTSNGDPALVAAFAELGWSDPYPIEDAALLLFPPDDQPPVAEPAEGPLEAATLEARERAVLETPEGHLV